MDLLNVFFGICTVLGLGLALYEYFSNRSRASIERAKVMALSERVEHTKYSIAIVHDTVDLAIQRLKSDPTRDVTDLLRVARGSLGVSIRELEEERLRLKTWKFGRLLESKPETAPDVAQIPADPKPAERESSDVRQAPSN